MTQVFARLNGGEPNNISSYIVTKTHNAALGNGEMGDLVTDHCAGDRFVFTGWNGQPVLIKGVQRMNEVKKFVPSLFSIRLQGCYYLKEPITDLVCSSIFGRSFKFLSVLGERELDALKPSFTLSERGGDIEVGVVKGRAEIVDSVSDDCQTVVYDEYVCFGFDDTLVGYAVRFKNVKEGRAFDENVGKLSDMLRGPFNL